MQHNLDSSPLPWLLSILRDAELRSSVTSVVNARTIGLMHQLLFKNDYVNVVAHLTDTSDVKNLLDFMLYLLRNGYLSNLGAQLEANRRARRLMLKVVSETPVIPKSLFITGVTVNVDVSCIAAGGFGLVFKGELQGKLVALKILHKFSHKSVDFCREALTWRSLDHKFVLPLLGVYKDHLSSQLFLVSPYMKNGTLAQWRKEADPSATEIKDCILEVAQGIQYIHSEGVVHGDIRGDNILLDASFHVQIADFGLTRHLEATVTQSGARHQNFAAPELFGDWDSEDDASDDAQSRARTQNSDVYAFGCLFYEIQFGMCRSITIPCHLPMSTSFGS
ncbi:hypothetical protein AX14_014460 [Amanita brunnescens Koide BX004]|nr:hypothetical protein AX14_014460 [Amanita brunnescens Koide BX004]